MALVWACLAVLPACKTPPGQASHPPTLPPSTSYLRAERLADGTSELRIACRRFDSRAHPGVPVWLVGASHIGSPAYYQSLQELLDARICVSRRYTSFVGGIRVSTHAYTTEEEIDVLCAAVRDAAGRKARSGVLAAR